MYLSSGVLVALSLSMTGMSEAGVRGIVLGVCRIVHVHN